MAFSIRHIEEDGLALVRLQDESGLALADILPMAGALLHNFSILLGETQFNCIDHYADRADLEKTLDRSYKSSKLSPFVCRIDQGKYEWLGKEYEFKKKFPDGSSIHGLLYNRSFSIIHEFADEHTASVRLKYSYTGSDEGYPFPFNCEVTYSLNPGAILQLETTILNLSDDPIPVADGWHPYFRLGGLVNGYTLQFSASSMLAFSDKLIPSGEIAEFDEFREPTLLGDRFFDNCFPLNIVEGSPCCVLRNPGNGLSLSLFASEKYPYLQIYTPPHRKSIAIENLSAAPDAFNNGMGITILEPRHSETYTCWYQLQAGENG